MAIKTEEMTEFTIKMSYYYDIEHPDPKTKYIQPIKAEKYRGVLVLYPVNAPQPSKTKLMAIKRCPFCGKDVTQYMTRSQFKTIKEGGWINNPSLSEMFITGICDDCWPSEPEE